jgi:hypothetical protein
LNLTTPEELHLFFNSIFNVGRSSFKKGEGKYHECRKKKVLFTALGMHWAVLVLIPFFRPERKSGSTPAAILLMPYLYRTGLPMLPTALWQRRLHIVRAAAGQ